MCKKIEDMREIARAQGREEGREEGRKKGKIEGILETITDLVKDGLISAAEGAKRAGMSVTDFEAMLSKT